MRNLNEGKKKSPSYMAELAEIDKQSAVVAMESKINHLQEMADKKKERLSMVHEDENLSELIDKKRVKMMEREIKEIERAKMKLEKLYEKMTGGKKKEMVDEEEKMDEGHGMDSMYDEDDSVSEGGYGSTTYEEDDVEEGIEDELKKNKGKTWDEAEPAQVTKEKGLAEEYLRMQKLAGVISEEEYKKKLNEKESYDLKVGGALNSLKGLNVSYMYEEGKPVNTKIVSTDVGETKDGKEFININFSPDTGMTLTDDDFVAWGSQRQKGVFPVSDSRKMKKTVVSKEFFEKLSPILKNLGISPKGLVNDSTSGGIFNSEKKYVEGETNQLKTINSVLPKDSGTNWKFFNDKTFTKDGMGRARFISSEGNKLIVTHEGQDKNVNVSLSFVKDDEGFDPNSLKQPIKDFFKKAFNIDISDVKSTKGYIRE